MQVLSRCPLGVASILWLPRSGSYTLTVVCKATFRLEPDVSPLAEDQEPVTEGDTYWDQDEGKSLDLATDLVPFKRSPELLLVGHAFAPQSAHVGMLVARVTVAEIDKAIEITGDRYFKLDGSLSHPARFQKMPLRWERAAGGPDTSNPVGVPMGEEARPDGWGRIAVPNLVQLGRVIASREDVVPPACFGPMAPHWPLRLSRLHRHAVGWSPHAWHARPLPADFDAAYFNAAPPDQMLREIVGTERITLENLHPRHPVLATRLTRVTPRAVVDWGTGGAHEIGLACDTLLIDTDRGVATLTYRGHVTLDYPERSGWVIVTTDEAGRGAMPAWEGRGSVADEAGRGAMPAWEGRGSIADEAGRGAMPAWEGRGVTADPPLDPRAPAALWARRAATVELPSELPAPAPAAWEGRGAAAEAPRAPPTFGLPAWVADVRDVNETVAHEGDDGASTALPFVEPGADLDLVLPDDLDDEETFAGQHAETGARPAAAAGTGARPAVSGASGVPAVPFAGGVPAVPFAGGAPAVPPVVPKGPRLGAFRLAAAPGVEGAGASLEDAPTMDPDDAVLEELTEDPSTARPVGAVGVPVPASELAAAPPPPVGATRPVTWQGAAVPAAPVMPFASVPAAAGVSALADTGARAPVAAAGLPFAAVTPVPPAPPSQASAPGRTIGEMVAQTRGLPMEGPPRFTQEPTQDLAPGEVQAAAPGEPPAPPPRLGPLAKEEAPATAGEAGSTGAAPEAPPAGAPAAAEDGPAPLPIEKYPLERCARIAASVARSRDREAEILESHELDAERWEPLKAHWAAEIKKETERGKTALLRAYDAAYVAQLEDERGPIAVEEYARIVVASERGTVSATLAELGLPEGSMLRIQRVWMGRTGKDPELRRLVRSAVEIASEE